MLGVARKREKFFPVGIRCNTPMHSNQKVGIICDIGLGIPSNFIEYDYFAGRSSIFLSVDEEVMNRK